MAEENQTLSELTGLVAGKCSRCSAEIIWLRQNPTIKNPSPKMNPLDNVPSEQGNLLILREKHETEVFYRYKVADAESADKHRKTGGKTFISHFVTCPYAKDFRQIKKRK